MGRGACYACYAACAGKCMHTVGEQGQLRNPRTKEHQRRKKEEDRRKEHEEKKEERNGGCSWPVENFRRMKNPTRRRSACRFPRNRLTGAPNSESKQEKGSPQEPNRKAKGTLEHQNKNKTTKTRNSKAPGLKKASIHQHRNPFVTFQST